MYEPGLCAVYDGVYHRIRFWGEHSVAGHQSGMEFAATLKTFASIAPGQCRGCDAGQAAAVWDTNINNPVNLKMIVRLRIPSIYTLSST